MGQEVCIFWFRRDLRLEDNTGLHHALLSGRPVLPLFIFDTAILSGLENPADARVEFIHAEIRRLREELEKAGGTLLVRHGEPEQVWRELADEFPLKAVFTNRDYEPYATDRDRRVKEMLASRGITWTDFKDQVIFEREEILKDNGEPYTVYTPYSRRWKALLKDSDLDPRPSEEELSRLAGGSAEPVPSLEDLGFRPAGLPFPSRQTDEGVIRNYHTTRDVPGLPGTSRLSLHLRFGTISPRALMAKARRWNEKFFDELIWREFYQYILHHFPHTATDSFKPAYDRIRWENNPEHFQRWCSGTTGFPLVDAGMRELNATGYMHNRTRMLTASFLTKHLLIDWRWGERYFAARLLDYDLASNVGGWQWAAGCGVDAAPYFRVFNPDIQLEKFDPDRVYVKRWVPEYGTSAYPKPMIDHHQARDRALERYKEALSV